MRKKLFVVAALAALATVALASTAGCGGASEADSYPTKPITYLVVWDPGGQSDRTARQQQPMLEKALGQKIVIDYKVGGGGAVGWAEFVRAKPDGYTIVGTNLPTIVTQPMLQEVGYKTEQFLPIVDFQYTPLVMAVKKDSPYQDLKSFIDAAKQNPGKMSVGGVALWSITHIMALELQKQYGIEVQFVPHSGSASLVTNWLGGHVDAAIFYTDDMVRQQEVGNALVIATENKFPGLEQFPTSKEAGFNFTGGVSRGVALPAGAPDYALKKLEKAFLDIAKDPEVIEGMKKEGFESRAMGSEEFKKEIEAQTKLYEEYLKDADVNKEPAKK
ncbi:MAG: tripartite tricarboxylate transporter substrate binding protein [Chloroflexota bacterium]|jgi:tripartite-type tricarboxylate transporter receptor subunit TctC